MIMLKRDDLNKSNEDKSKKARGRHQMKCQGWEHVNVSLHGFTKSYLLMETIP